MKKSFTLIELIFVIVIIGILSAVAIPKFNATKIQAVINSAKVTVSNIRSAVSNLRAKNQMKGKCSYAIALDDANKNTEGEELFDGNESIGQILDYPIYSANGEGKWMKIGDTNYTVIITDENITFNYYPNNGHFDCKGLNSGQADDLCTLLTR